MDNAPARRIPDTRMRRRSGLRRLGLVPAKRDLECLHGWNPKVFGHHPEPILTEMQVFSNKIGRHAKYSACNRAISNLFQQSLYCQNGCDIDISLITWISCT